MIVGFVLAVVLLAVAMAAAGALAILLRDARTQIVRERQAHLAETERLNTTHATLMERVLNMQTYGTPTPKEATISEREPDAESRVLRRISQESIEAGASALKKMYEDAGIIVTIEEVRDEATSMLMGISPSVAPNRGLLVKDGP